MKTFVARFLLATFASVAFASTAPAQTPVPPLPELRRREIDQLVSTEG